MKWYRGLYMGEGARKAKYKVLGHVVKKKFSFDTYLIRCPLTLPIYLIYILPMCCCSRILRKNVYRMKSMLLA